MCPREENVAVEQEDGKSERMAMNKCTKIVQHQKQLVYYTHLKFSAKRYGRLEQVAKSRCGPKEAVEGKGKPHERSHAPHRRSVHVVPSQ